MKFDSLKFRAGLLAALAPLAGCGRKDGAAGVTAPGIEEVEAIATKGFIFDLPLVMNYGVQYAFSLDKNSAQFKAPPNTLFNERRVFTWKDTAVITPNGDTSVSLVWLDLRAEPMAITEPAVHPKRYDSLQRIDGNTFNYPKLRD